MVSFIYLSGALYVYSFIGPFNGRPFSFIFSFVNTHPRLRRRLRGVNQPQPPGWRFAIKRAAGG
jgi:hypothetical protein